MFFKRKPRVSIYFTSLLFCFIFNAGLIYITANHNLTGNKYIPSVIPAVAEHLKVFVTGVNYSSVPILSQNSSHIARSLIMPKKPSTVTRFKTIGSHSVLWYNKPGWIQPVEFTTQNIKSKCEYTYCRFTEDKSDLNKHSAIMYFIHSKLPSSPPVPASSRRRDQVWLFYSNESPVNHDWITYRNHNWRHTMNWSMSYRTDADIFFPYGVLHPQTQPPKKDYVQIFRQKTKFAAWIVSHCNAESGRDWFATELADHGLPVDIFGRCGDGKRWEREDLVRVIDRDYKFYLSLENSLCADYITEKFFDWYPKNVILVVRGGLTYHKLMPDVPFINTEEFTSTKHLAEYLLKLASNESMFVDFMQRKDRFSVGNVDPFCEICAKLNNLEQHEKIYTDVTHYLQDNICKEPQDLDVFFPIPDKVNVIVCVLFLVSVILPCFLCLSSIHKYKFGRLRMRNGH